MVQGPETTYWRPFFERSLLPCCTLQAHPPLRRQRCRVLGRPSRRGGDAFPPRLALSRVGDTVSWDDHLVMVEDRRSRRTNAN